jgi:GNAT superfamily N-acetyltransferase
LLIGRLAVDRRYQGRQLGAALLFDAIARAIRADAAVFALLVDAKDEAAAAPAQTKLRNISAACAAPRSAFITISLARISSATPKSRHGVRITAACRMAIR